MGLIRSNHGNRDGFQSFTQCSFRVPASLVSTNNGDHSASLFGLIMSSMKIATKLNDKLTMTLGIENHGTRRSKALRVV